MPVQTGSKSKVKSSSSKKPLLKKRTRSVSRKSKSVPRKSVPRKNTKGKSTKKTPLSKWQLFLKKHGGKGHSQKSLLAMYKRDQK